MTYVEYKEVIRAKLTRRSSGMTWKELRDELDLPYSQPCPAWTARLENEIGLVRRKMKANASIWMLEPMMSANALPKSTNSSH